MKTIKLDPPKYHDDYVKPKKFDNIPLPVNLPPITKPQVNLIIYFFKKIDKILKFKTLKRF